MNFSLVASSASGGYKLIDRIYKNSSVTITPKSGQVLFEGTVSHLRNVFGHAISYPFVENMLCELWRDLSPKRVAVRDYYYFHSHRENCFQGLQNLVRFKYESGRTMSLQLLPLLQSKSVAEDQDDYVGQIMTLFKWNGGTLSGSASESEITRRTKGGRPDGDPRMDSVMVVSHLLASYFRVINVVETENKNVSRRGGDNTDNPKSQCVSNVLDQTSPSSVSISSALASVNVRHATVRSNSVAGRKRRQKSMYHQVRQKKEETNRSDFETKT